MAHPGLSAPARLVLALALALLATGCPPPAEVAPPPTPQPSASVQVQAAPPLGAGKWGNFASPRFGLELPLPDGHAWKIDDHSGPWLSGSHPGTGSQLVVRTWREDGIANRRRCEEQARLWRKLPDEQGADIVEQRSVNVPPDFDTRVQVGVVAPLPGPPQARAPSNVLRGFALAFGGKAHRCFAFAFTTSAQGPGAEQAVGERLATMVQGSLEKIQMQSELDPHIPREPLPSELPGSPLGR